MAAPQSSPLPVAPQRNEAEADFTQKANAFVSALEPFRQELQVQADFINNEVDQFDANLAQAVADATQTATDARDTAVSAAASASQDAADAEVFRNESESAKDAALALVNFVGKWADLTGALNTPATVFHQGAYWRLLNDLADVTASEPANDNADWLFVYSNAELRRKLLDEATLYADFVNGDYRLYEGVGAGVVRNKAFGDLFNFTRASDALGLGVSAFETVPINTARFVFSPENRKREGLSIEEQRTNFAVNSELSSATGLTRGGQQELNVATNLAGITTGAKIYGTVTSLSYVYSQGYAAEADTDYAFSCLVAYEDRSEIVFGNPSVENSDQNPFSIVINGVSLAPEHYTIKRLPGNVYRISGVYNKSTSGVAGWGILKRTTHKQGTPAIVFTAFQIEKGSFATSYIKAESGQVTRSAEDCSRTLGQEFNADEGTFFLEFEKDNLNVSPSGGWGTNATLMGVKWNSVNQYADTFYLQINQGKSSLRFAYGDSGYGLPQVANLGATNKIRAAITYKGGEIQIAVNGFVDAATNSPPEQLEAPVLNIFNAAGGRISGPLPRLTYTPRAHTKFELIALTQPEAE